MVGWMGGQRTADKKRHKYFVLGLPLNMHLIAESCTLQISKLLVIPVWPLKKIVTYTINPTLHVCYKLCTAYSSASLKLKIDSCQGVM